MASHGKVCDLFDDRYLNLQDVYGNVEPFPSLVPYEQYQETILVYRIDTNHEVYMALLQEFTDRFARGERPERREAWTWCVQWEVEKPIDDTPYTPAAKKQRLDAHSDAAQNKELAQRKPAYTKIERRLLHPDLFQEEDMLRILIDIVQVDSKLVPNYIEFLYQWVDYYEGSGRALKAALRMEIPSLWLFEYHPLPLYDSSGKDKNRESDSSVDGEEVIGSVDNFRNTTKEMGERLKKPQKPLALEEMERMTEQSERLEYREVKFGMQRPIDPNEEPLPPLINMPYDTDKRNKYYAACFKNRQRAFWLLQEAGITTRQIANYKRLQKMSALNTPENINGDGWLNYYKEEPYNHAEFLNMQRIKELREKQREIAMSNRLAEEARIAATNSAGNPGSLLPPALIPPTLKLPPPLTTGRPDMLAEWLAKVKSISRDRDPPVKSVPAPLFGKMKSEMFRHAVAASLPLPRTRLNGDVDMSDNDSDDDEYSNPDDIDPDEREDAMDADSAGLPRPPPGYPTLVAYLLTLTPVELANFMPRFSPQAQASIRQHYPGLFRQNPVPQASTVASGMQAGIAGPSHATAPGIASMPFNHTNGGSIPPLPTSLPQQQSQTPDRQDQQQQNLRWPYEQNVPGHFQLPPPPSSPMEAARLAAAQMQANGTPYTGPWFPSLVNQGMGTSQPRPQHISSAMHYLQQTILQRQLAQAGTTGLGGSSGAQDLQPGGAPYYGLPQNPSMSGLNTAPAMTVTQPASGSSMEGHDVPRGVTPALLALLQSSRNIAPTIMAAQGQTPSGEDQQDPTQGPSNLTSNSYSYASFARMLQASTRAAPPPNLTLQPTQPAHLPTHPGAPSLMTPLAGLANSLRLTSPLPQPLQPGALPHPFQPLSQIDPLHATRPEELSPHGLPIQIYLPRVVIPHSSNLADATDCLLLGYTSLGTGVLTLHKAIFLPTSIRPNLQRRLQRQHAVVLEVYNPPANHPRFSAGKGVLRNPDDVKGPHRFVHDKVAQVFDMMTACDNREEELTKRWRSSPGPMTARCRGSVWEGWALVVDAPVEMGYEERHGEGVIVNQSLDGHRGFGLTAEEWEYREMRRREVEEMIAEDEEDVSDEEGGPMQHPWWYDSGLYFTQHQLLRSDLHTNHDGNIQNNKDSAVYCTRAHCPVEETDPERLPYPPTATDDVFGDESTTEVHYKSCKWYHTDILMIAETISLGVLALPKTLASLAHPSVESFADCGELIAGPLGREVMAAAQLLILIFISAAHILSFAIALNVMTEHATCTVVFSVVGGVISFFCTLPRTLKKVSYFSVSSCISVILAVAMAAIAREAPAPGHIVLVRPDIPLVKGLGPVMNIVLACAGHVTFFGMFSELADPREFKKAVLLNQVFAVVFYVVLASVIYFFAGELVASPVLGSASPLARKIAFGIALPTIVIAGVINNHVGCKYVYLRICGVEMAHRRSVKSWASWAGIVGGMWAVSWVVAEAVPFFNVLLGLIAALFSSWFSYGLPPVLALWQSRGRRWENKTRGMTELNFGVMLLGAAICVMGMWSSEYELSQMKAGEVFS
ncbi:amino acid transporter [Paraphaeosphaeria minitans]|uniref:Amino acid transporter n=1 Tax=Paraphaeosphaeria minitans TaxID=565426 RepID=A0A9P6KU95_9PLEO|nr:amino acid transporter [Paraphaeosphaeria minitans]